MTDLLLKELDVTDFRSIRGRVHAPLDAQVNSRSLRRCGRAGYRVAHASKPDRRRLRERGA